MTRPTPGGLEKGAAHDEFETGDQAGSSVALGDLNGDGEIDYAVGAPFDDKYGSNSGAAYGVYGPVEGQ